MNTLARFKPNLSLNTWLRIGVGVLLVLAFLVHESGLYQYRFVQQLEFFLYDARIRLFMPNTLDPRIVIADIDEKSLAAEGRWPWSRDKHAMLVRQLFERYKVRTVGFDVAFPEKDDSSGLSVLEKIGKGDLKDDPGYQGFLENARKTLDYDRILADEIAKYPVVLGFFLSPGANKAGVLPPPTFTDEGLKLKGRTMKHHVATGYSGNIPILQANAAAAGHLYPALDFDGVTRRVPMFHKYQDGYYEALSLALARTYLGNIPARVTLEELQKDLVAVSAIKLNQIEIPLDQYMSALVPFRGATGVFQHVSATEVIRGTLAEDALRDKIVIVGTSAQGLFDLRATPVKEDYPGVEVHANLISGFLDGRVMHEPHDSQAVSVLTLLIVGLAFAILLPRLSALISTVAVLSVTVILIAVNLVVWKKGYVLSVGAPVLMMIVLFLLNMAWGFFMETRSRRLISGLFGTYVPKELVAEMSRNPEEYSMRGESRNMTVLFSDVRNFTTISEGLTPEGLRDMMNAYLTEMTEVIQATRGTIDKYIGDAIMSFWGAPLNDADHAAHGVEAALAMQKRIRALDDSFVKRGWPLLHIGIGLNSGEMNVGDMGSKFRRAYTVLGDRVNTAARLEGLTKEYGLGILVTEYTVEAAPQFVYREVDAVVVKGRTTGLGIYEPMGRVGEVGETTLQEIDRFHKALAAYRKQRWDDAAEHLKALAYAAPDSKLYKLYMKRIEHFRQSPPGPMWNGTWVFTTK